VSPVPDATLCTEWGLRLVPHEAHAPGHAALVVEAAGALIAGDMLSDVEIPLLDPTGDDPWGDYATGLHRLEAVVTPELVTVIPGHGRVAHGAEIRSRLAADRAYLDALRRTSDPAEDPRIGPGATYGRDWLPEAHQRNLALSRQDVG
jgi:glyoxylase-like metal-dependent hydrolase (beta-lactamase superfamily II)